MNASRLMSVFTNRLMCLGIVVKEFQTPRSSVTPPHPQSTANKYGKEIYTGTDRKLVKPSETGMMMN